MVWTFVVSDDEPESVSAFGGELETSGILWFELVEWEDDGGDGSAAECLLASPEGVEVSAGADDEEAVQGDALAGGRGGVEIVSGIYVENPALLLGGVDGSA